MKGATNVTGEMALPTGTGAITSGPGGGSVAIGESDRIRENKKDVEIVGIKDATYKIIDRNLTFTENYGTGSTDWYTLRANAVRIKVVNGVGTNKVLEALTILGKIVWRHSGEQGFIHDAFSDYEDILRNGERLFKLENNMICTFPQVNQLADYWWKYYRTKKHIYQVTIAGTQHQYKIGSWYELQIGGPGEVEYIDSTVMLTGKTVERGAASIGRTTLTFREVEENWKADSNAIARFNAASNPGKVAGRVNQLTVASNDYVGTADYYCDGVNDQVEIQAAIDRLTSAYGGGKVYLTEGNYYIESYLDIKEGVLVVGAGELTLLTCSDINRPLRMIGDGSGLESLKITSLFSTYRTLIEVTGENAVINKISVLGVSDATQREDIVLGVGSRLTNSFFKSIERCSLADGCIVANNVADNCYYFVAGFMEGDSLKNVIISGNNISGDLTNTHIIIQCTDDGRADNVVIANNSMSGGLRGIELYTDPDGYITQTSVTGNIVSDCTQDGIALLGGDSLLVAKGVVSTVITGNIVSSCGGHGIRLGVNPALQKVEYTIVSANRATLNATNYGDYSTGTTTLSGNDFS